MRRRFETAPTPPMIGPARIHNKRHGLQPMKTSMSFWLLVMRELGSALPSLEDTLLRQALRLSQLR